MKRHVDDKPQCPALLDGELPCHLRFGHDGQHLHYISSSGCSIVWPEQS